MAQTDSTTPPKYTYRSTRIAGHLAVYVTNHTNETIYTVMTNGRHPRCNCPHYQHRLAGTLRACKHITGAVEFLAQDQQPAPAPREAGVETEAEKHERVRADRALWG